MCKKLITVLTVGIFLLSYANCLQAQTFNLNGNGARAAGMGYAFTAIADDATAISWNSAGLTQLYSMEASLVGGLGFGSLSTDYSEIEYNYERGSKFQINFASFVVPFTAGGYNIVGGVAYRRIYDFTEKRTTKLSVASFNSICITIKWRYGIS